MAKRRARAATRRTMPSVWNPSQLSEEMRIALGLAERPAVIQYGDGTVPQVIARRTMQGRGKRRAEVEVPWTEQQQATIISTLESHVADSLWDEKNEDRIIRLTIDNADFAAYRDKPNAEITPVETVRATKDLIRFAIAVAKRIRNEA